MAGERITVKASGGGGIFRAQVTASPDGVTILVEQVGAAAAGGSGRWVAVAIPREVWDRIGFEMDAAGRDAEAPVDVESAADVAAAG